MFAVASINLRTISMQRNRYRASRREEKSSGVKKQQPIKYVSQQSKRPNKWISVLRKIPAIKTIVLIKRVGECLIVPVLPSGKHRVQLSRKRKRGKKERAKEKKTRTETLHTTYLMNVRIRESVSATNQGVDAQSHAPRTWRLAVRGRV